MASNYSLVVGSKFRPFSYSEMLQPVQMADTEHKLIEEGIGELSTKSSVWDSLANQQTDPYAYNMYKNYSTDLANKADQLSKEGLTPGSRKALIDMKRRYGSDIVPIEQAYSRRKELVDEQRKLLAQDNTLMFDRSASTLTLDDLIKNPTISPQSYSGSLITKQVASAAQNLSKDMRDNPREWRNILGNQYFETIMKKGYSPDEIIKVLQNDPKASPILSRIVEDAVSSSGIKNWADTGTIKRAYEYGQQGLWGAVGETQYQQVTNKAYDYAMQERLANAKKKSEEGDTPRLSYRSTPRLGINPEAKTTQLKSDIDFLRAAVKDDSILRKKTQAYQGQGVSTSGQAYGQLIDTYPNRERLKAITAKYGDTNPESLIKKMQKEIDYSAVVDYKYSTNLADNSLLNKVVKENLASMSTSKGVPAYEYEDGKKGNKLKASDLKDLKGSDGFINYDPMGAALLYTYPDKDGEYKTIQLDTEVLGDPDGTLKKIQKDIDLAKKNEDYGNMSILINEYMSYIDGKFNTMAKVQGTTDSKFTPMWGGE